MSRVTISINEETSINRAVESNLQVGVVLESPRGAVLTPTRVRSEAELTLLFGESSVKYPVLALVRAYLKQYSGVLISRIKYKDAKASTVTVNDKQGAGALKITGKSFSDYENGQTVKITKADNKYSVVITGTDNVVTSSVTELSTDLAELVDEFNSRSLYYTMELLATDTAKELKVDETPKFAGGVQGKTFDKDDVIKALQAFDSVNIPRVDIICAPGLNTDVSVVNAGVKVATDRKESIYLADVPEKQDYSAMLQTVATYPRTSELAVYYPSVLMSVPTGANKMSKMMVPASAACLFAWAMGSKSTQYGSPAGWTPDYKLPNTTATAVELTSAQVSEMYEATETRPAVNPIIFDNTIGYLVDGQRTTAKSSSLQYPINVARLVKHVWFITREISKPFAYKPNVDFTWSEWRLAMSTKLNNIKKSQGLQEFKVAMGVDETMTQQEVNQGIMRGVVKIRPMFLGEYIEIAIGVTTEVIGGEQDNG